MAGTARAVFAFGRTDQIMSALPRSGPQPAADSFAVGAALLARVGELERQSPVVLGVDDLHWCDPASSRALLSFLRRLRADVVLAVLTIRPHSIELLSAGWNRMLADASFVRSIRLSGLTAAEVRELAAPSGRELTIRAAERLREHTDGNPLYSGVVA
jgi:predicted ATPase